MQLLFRLPLLLLEMLLRRGTEAVFGVVQRVRDDGGDDVVSPVQEPPAPPAAPASPAPAYTAPPPTAEEAMERRFTREREAAEAAGIAEAANGSVDPETAARARPAPETTHVDREAEVVESFGPAEDVVATIQVDAPWEGYDAMPATQIVARLRDADPATKGVARMYEQQHKKRATVLRATG